ncbi:MAG: ABC transporter substrate-binding protein [Candidatus Bipolaricaulota bacterium]|nr:ABC transporter substrate-binding protein [Candidatus Bipolaricaulota bacterium]MDW8030382.1 ABC transporter substrate-binding protein [Candidatus Bipolaricaulota bacterium]
MRAALSRRTFLRALGVAAGALLLGPYRGYSQQTITIGVLGSTTSPLGQGILNGAQLAASELNVRLIPGDLGRETDPARARAVLTELISKGADAVVGLSRSDTIPALLLEIPRLKKPVIITGTPLLGTDQVAANYESFKYIFRAGIVNAAAQAFDGGEFAREFLVDQLIKAKILRSNAVALVGDPSKQSADFRSALLPRLIRAGLDVVGNLADGQAGALLERLQKIDVPAAITVFFDAKIGAEFAQSWSAKRVKIALFGWNEALLFDDLKGAAAGYVVVDFAAETATVGPKTLDFYKRYQEQFRARPVFTAATTYDAVYALADAVARARTTEAEALVRALEGTRLNGVVGVIRFYTVEEQQRDPLKIAIAHDQVYGLTKTGGAPAFDGVRPFYTQISPAGTRVVLYPPEYATGSYVLPPHFG